MDNGMDDWTGQDDADEEDDEEEHLRSRKSCTYASNRYRTLILDHGTAKKKAAGASAKAKVKPKAPAQAAKPSISAYRPTVSVEQEDDFMANLLGGIDTAPLPAPVRPKKRKSSPVLDYDDIVPDRSSSPVPYRKNSNTYAYSSDGAADDEPSSNPPSSDFEDYSSPKKKVRVTDGSSVVMPAVERMGKLEVHSGSEDALDASMDFSDVDMNDFMAIDDLDVKPSVPVKKELKLDSKPIPNSANTPKKEDPSWLSVYDSLAVVSEESLGSKPALSRSSINALEDDGSLRIFWLDYLEHGGKLYLIGKVKDKTSNTWASVCLSIQGIQRNLFVLPRPLRVVQDETEDGQVEMVETDVVPEKGDVYNDFERIRREIGIKGWKARWVTRKYAFDYKDVPKETEWMKVLYSYEGGRLAGASGLWTKRPQSRKFPWMLVRRISTRSLVQTRASSSFSY
jgi:DNA polymerase alpha subunit A